MAERAAALRLATIEWQLVLQFCVDVSSFLSLARCSRHLCAAAQHSFAWRGRGVAWVSSAAAARARTRWEQEPRFALLRDKTLGLRWTYGDPEEQGQLPLEEQPPIHPAEVMEMAHALPRSAGGVIALDTRGRFRVQPTHLAELLCHESFAQLTELHCGRTAFDAEVWAALVEHQRTLQTLSFCATNFTPPPVRNPVVGRARVPRASLVPLANIVQLEHLTSLSVIVSRGAPGVNGLEHLASCATLRTLHLQQASFPELETILMSPLLAASLQHLVVANTNLRVDAETWQAVLANLHALTRLELVDCTGVSEPLQLLAEQPAVMELLRTLRIATTPVLRGRESQVQFLARTHGLPVPSAALLHSLMLQRPDVLVELRLESLAAWLAGWHGDESGLHLPKVQLVRQELEQLRDDPAHRNKLNLSFADKRPKESPPASDATRLFRMERLGAAQLAAAAAAAAASVVHADAVQRSVAALGLD